LLWSKSHQFASTYNIPYGAVVDDNDDIIIVGAEDATTSGAQWFILKISFIGQ